MFATGVLYKTFNTSVQHYCVIFIHVDIRGIFKQEYMMGSPTICYIVYLLYNKRMQVIRVNQQDQSCQLIVIIYYTLICISIKHPSVINRPFVISQMLWSLATPNRDCKSNFYENSPGDSGDYMLLKPHPSVAVQRVTHLFCSGATYMLPLETLNYCHVIFYAI